MPSTPYVPTSIVLDATDIIHAAALDVLRVMAKGPRLLKPEGAAAIADKLSSIIVACADLQVSCRRPSFPSGSTSP